MPLPSASRASDRSKTPTVEAIRATRARLTPISLRGLREDLFKLELSLLEQMVRGGIDVTIVAVLANPAKALEAVERLEAGPPGAR